MLGRGDDYRLNVPNGIDINVLEYSRKSKAWEYYYLDERGGKSQLRAFATEEEACEYALEDAISSLKRSTERNIDNVERWYLGKPDPQKRPLMSLDQIFDAIRLLGTHKSEYLDDPDRTVGVYTSGYNNKWNYGLFTKIADQPEEWTVFSTEEEARQYVIEEALEIIRTFGAAWEKAKKRTDTD